MFCEQFKPLLPNYLFAYPGLGNILHCKFSQNLNLNIEHVSKRIVNQSNQQVLSSLYLPLASTSFMHAVTKLGIVFRSRLLKKTKMLMHFKHFNITSSSE